MGFYSELSKVYDQVFPVRPETVRFLTQGLEPGSKLLDIGCGSGECSRALAELGYELHAIDLDPDMVTAARTAIYSGSIQCSVMNMMELELHFPPRSFDMVFCIGNVLANLPSREAISQALRKMGTVLKNEASLVLQLVNYDRILAEKITSLPTIENEKAQIRFKREYSLAGSDSIEFSSTLCVGAERYENTTSLVPIRYGELSALLTEAGFGRANAYGGFDSSAYRPDSPALVMRAWKQS